MDELEFNQFEEFLHKLDMLAQTQTRKRLSKLTVAELRVLGRHYNVPYAMDLDKASLLDEITPIYASEER